MGKKLQHQDIKKKLAQDFLNIDLILLSFSSSIVAWAIDYKIDIIIANIFREKHPIFHNKNIIYANNLIELNKALSTKLQNIRKKKNILNRSKNFISNKFINRHTSFNCITPIDHARPKNSSYKHFFDIR